MKEHDGYLGMFQSLLSWIKLANSAWAKAKRGRKVFQSLLSWIKLANNRCKTRRNECNYCWFQSLLSWIKLANTAADRRPLLPPAAKFQSLLSWIKLANSAGREAALVEFATGLGFQSLLSWIKLANSGEARRRQRRRLRVSILVVMDQARQPDINRGPRVRVGFQSLLSWIKLANAMRTPAQASRAPRFQSLLSWIKLANWKKRGYDPKELKFQSLLSWIKLANQPLGDQRRRLVNVSILVVMDQARQRRP